MAVAITLATPEALVNVVPAERTAEAPEAGAENVIGTPLTGMPEESVNVTWSGVEKATPTCADWGRVGEAVMTDADAGRLVNWNCADTPRAVAVTV